MGYLEVLTELIKRLIVSLVIVIKDMTCCYCSCFDTEISIVSTDTGNSNTGVALETQSGGQAGASRLMSFSPPHNSPVLPSRRNSI